MKWRWRDSIIANEFAFYCNRYVPIYGKKYYYYSHIGRKLVCVPVDAKYLSSFITSTFIAGIAYNKNRRAQEYIRDFANVRVDYFYMK